MTRRAVLTLAAGAILSAAAGAAIAWRWKPAPPPLFRTVEVHDAAIQALVPHVKPTVADRVTKRAVAPTQVATTKGTPDTATIAAFCAARISTLLATNPLPDSVPIPPPEPPVVLPPFSGRFADNQLELEATRSDGSQWAATFHVTPPLEWVAGQGGASDTAAIVRENRAIFRLLPHLGRCARGGAIGGVLGLGAALLGDVSAGKGLALGAAAGCLGGSL